MIACIHEITMPTHPYISLSLALLLYQLNLINHDYSLRRIYCSVQYILISSLICRAPAYDSIYATHVFVSVMTCDAFELVDSSLVCVNAFRLYTIAAVATARSQSTANFIMHSIKLSSPAKPDLFINRIVSNLFDRSEFFIPLENKKRV